MRFCDFGFASALDNTRGHGVNRSEEVMHYSC